MSHIEPLLANAGGIVDPEDLVGRAAELTALLGHIANGGAYVVGDRRMGKTSLLRKAKHDLEAVGHMVVSVSAESSTLKEFADELLTAIRHQSRLANHVRRWSTELGGELSLSILGTGFRLTGKATRGTPAQVDDDLLALCADAVRRVGPGRLVIMIDEIAVLAEALHAQERGSAVPFLHSLRRARQTYPDVSLVLSGSVGLHHSVPDLSVVNDLPEVFVGPLAEADGVLLARRLLAGAYDQNVASSDIAEVIASECSNIAYYIQELVNRLSLGPPPAPRRVRDTVDEALAANDWRTDHYFDRIPKYYGEQTDLVIESLDFLARTSEALSLDEIHRDLAARMPGEPPDRRTVGELLRRMQRDHYLAVRPKGYAMATPFLRRVWRAVRERR